MLVRNSIGSASRIFEKSSSKFRREVVVIKLN